MPSKLDPQHQRHFILRIILVISKEQNQPLRHRGEAKLRATSDRTKTLWDNNEKEDKKNTLKKANLFRSPS